MPLRERHSFCIANAQKHSIFVISIRLTSALNRTSGSSKTLCRTNPANLHFCIAPSFILQRQLFFLVETQYGFSINSQFCYLFVLTIRCNAMHFGFTQMLAVIFGSVINISFSIPRQNRQQCAFLVTFVSVINSVVFSI